MQLENNNDNGKIDFIKNPFIKRKFAYSIEYQTKKHPQKYKQL